MGAPDKHLSTFLGIRASVASVLGPESELDRQTTEPILMIYAKEVVKDILGYIGSCIRKWGLIGRLKQGVKFITLLTFYSNRGRSPSQIVISNFKINKTFVSHY